MWRITSLGGTLLDAAARLSVTVNKRYYLIKQPYKLHTQLAHQNFKLPVRQDSSYKMAYQNFNILEKLSGNLIEVSPGLLTETSLRTGELCGQQAAARITSRITSPPKPIPRNAALDVDAANKTKKGMVYQ
jgi:hypothetical protein